jgi:adenylate cyclase
MTGGLQRLGGKIRLRVQLTEADTDRVIWPDGFHGDLSDLFAFQDEVTAMIPAGGPDQRQGAASGTF